MRLTEEQTEIFEQITELTNKRDVSRLDIAKIRALAKLLPEEMQGAVEEGLFLIESDKTRK